MQLYTPSTIIDDPSVPAETRIYYSKKKPVFETIILSGSLLLGLWFFFFEEGFVNMAFGVLLCIIAGIFLYTNHSIVTNKEVQLLLTNKGMQTPNTDFSTWQEITEESVTEESVKGNINYFLNYNYKNGSERMVINSLDTAPNEIEQLLGIYRKRSERN